MLGFQYYGQMFKDNTRKLHKILSSIYLGIILKHGKMQIFIKYGRKIILLFHH